LTQEELRIQDQELRQQEALLKQVKLLKRTIRKLRIGTLKAKLTGRELDELVAELRAAILNEGDLLLASEKRLSI
jgi:hypothetical protein